MGRVVTCLPTSANLSICQSVSKPSNPHQFASKRGQPIRPNTVFNTMTSMASPPLHYQEVHSSAPTPAGTKPRMILWLHSLLSSNTLYTDLAQRAADLAAEKTGDPWMVLLPDHRNHGGSSGLPGLNPPHTITNMANDVIRLLTWGQESGRWGQPEVIVGHSIGGLVAVEVARRLGEAAAKGGEGPKALGVPKQVWVLDSRCFTVDPNTPMRQNRVALLGAMHAVHQPLDSAEQLVEAVTKLMQQAGAPGIPPWLPALAQATLKPNPSGPGLVRQYETEALPEMFGSYYGTDLTPVLRAPPPGCTLHMVQGQLSDDWLEDGQAEVDFWREGHARGLRLHQLEGADHWIPLTHQNELLALMAAEFEGLKGGKQPGPRAGL